MAVESALYPSQFNTNWPQASDMVSEGDNHIRRIKIVDKTTWANIAGAVSASHIELNYVTGVTSGIQSQLNGKGSITGQTWTGAHVFSGSAAVPTLALSTSTTGAASTAFVQNEWASRMPNYTAPITASTTELNYSVGVTSGIQSQLNTKGAIAGQTWTGTHDFTGATARAATLPAGTATTEIATTAHVASVAFTSALPGQAGNAGKVVTTDGTNASWTNTIIATSLNGGPLAGLRNRVINGAFSVNQRAVSGTVTLAAGAYGHDRWKAGSGGCTYTFATTANVTTLTISAGSLQQVIEGVNLQSGTHVLSWAGTAQGRIGVGSYGASGTVTAAITGGTNTTIEFNTGTVTSVQLEPGTVATPSEQRPYGLELPLCQRYLPVLSDAGYYGTGLSISATLGYAIVPWQVQPRTAPTGLTATGGGLIAINAAGSTVPITSVSINSPSTAGSGITLNAASGLTVGGPLLFAGSTGSRLVFTGCEL